VKLRLRLRGGRIRRLFRLGLIILFLLVFAGVVSYATWRANRTGEALVGSRRTLFRVQIIRREEHPVLFLFEVAVRCILVALALLLAVAVAAGWIGPISN
jgi:hypothetical protein